MHYITIPNSILLVHPTTREPMRGARMEDGTLDKTATAPPITFSAFLFTCFLSRDGLFVGYQGAKALEEIEDNLRTAAVGAVVPVDDSTWKILEKGCTTLTIDPPWILRQYLPFLEVIMKAPDARPKEAV